LGLYRRVQGIKERSSWGLYRRIQSIWVCIDGFKESRNVHLRVCIDGFNSFWSFATPYSYWQVILTVYNLPLRMCMRREFMFLSTVKPSPNSPGRNIDVCLRPLIDELT